MHESWAVTPCVLAHRPYPEWISRQWLQRPGVTERLARGYAKPLHRHIARVNQQILRRLYSLAAPKQPKYVLGPHVNRPELVLSALGAFQCVVPVDPLIPPDRQGGTDLSRARFMDGRQG